MLFNVPVRALPYVAAGGALARGLRTALMLGCGMSVELATLVAVTALGMTGVWWARRLRAHPKVFTVAAVIPLVPGVAAFTSLMAVLQISQGGYSPELGRIAVEHGLRAFLIVGAMTVGLAAPGLLIYRGRPIV